jgi:uncharacterized repeat protein (TIGR04052 family)
MTHCTRLVSSAALAAFALSPLAACGDDGGHTHEHPDAGAVDAALDAGPLAVTIPFAAAVRGTAFSCGASITGVGTMASTYVASDFRFFVHDVALVPTGGGAPVPVTLTVNPHQSADGLALLDFENATGPCQMGSAATYTALVGTVPAGSYTGLRFKLGVPYAKNHVDPAGAPAPLGEPGMLWAWQSGYKFLKTDGAVGAAGFNLHVGSTGCPGGNPMQPPTAPCANPNVAEIVLPTFQLGASTVVADTGPVLAGVDVSVNTPATAPGCMSFPNDPECNTIFPKLGLPFGAIPAANQALFTVR